MPSRPTAGPNADPGPNLRRRPRASQDALVTSDDAEHCRSHRLAPRSLKKQTSRAYWEELERLLDRPSCRRKPPQDPQADQDENTSSSIIRIAPHGICRIDAEILAERMMLKWTKRPGIHLLADPLHGGEGLCSPTRSRQSGHWLYPDWLPCLAVVTDLPNPKAWMSQRTWWLSLWDAVHINYVIDEVAAASPGSWLAGSDPGLAWSPRL